MTANRSIFLFAVLAAFFASGAAAFSNEQVGAAAIPAKVLTANVGNADIGNCGAGYFYKLCQFKYEKILAQNIAAISPDIVALQEVFDSKWCASMPEEKKKAKVCHKYKEQTAQQVRRLLGDNYTIVCDGRSNFECTGIKKDFAAVENCQSGALCATPDRPLTDSVPDGCDDKPVIFGINIIKNGKVFRIVNGHPAATGEECRAGEVRRMFEGYDGRRPLADNDMPTLAMGDMNLDPFMDDPTSPDIIAWNSHVGAGKDFYYLSGPAERQPPYPTAVGKTIDHAITNFASGNCVTLGEAEGTSRLDGVAKGVYNPEANDHRAILCDLDLNADWTRKH